ncbi:glucosamine-6-phosphate deaminase [Phyllobacterium sp. YR531]|uniref:glucosamine-6-phosphate deaminase n=1 Tax=Phyllobacterium sp. YR531 TaxID=1144343 RepID=UPI00026F87AE|nr:glucosamine-6-phosphate deaminase [Phyllobacterium sp. YR531]EJM98425.1 6-phosphogluconolactonase/glucosamine-6-phosphate isomerase/deaminase [Phyllobacterium sp. YR531]
MIDIRQLPDKASLGAAAAKLGAEAIRAAISAKGKASIIVATGASQFEVLQNLVAAENIDWSKVTAFHLDEYVGMEISHPASFRKFLQERFVDPLGGAVAFHPINGEGDAAAEAERVSALITRHDIDVCFAGIGENCHLAFNDPPADFETDKPYIVVTLDEACRKQQMGEGWFPTLEAVPEKAISMSIRQILKSELIILSVPDERKSQAVKDAVQGKVDPMHPASIVQKHPNTVLFLEPHSASRLA